MIGVFGGNCLMDSYGDDGRRRRRVSVNLCFVVVMNQFRALEAY